MTTVLSLTSRIQSAGISLSVASASFDIWWTYASKDTRDLIAMNEFPSFFRYDEDAHRRNLIVNLYTLYDSHPDTISLKSLIHDLDPESAKPIWRKYKNATLHEAVSKISNLRHNVIAHRNASKSVNDIFREAGVTANHFRTLIAESLELLTMIAASIGVEAPMTSPFVTDDVSELLTRIKLK